MSRWDDKSFVHKAYATQDGLLVRIRAQRLFGVRKVDVFDDLTRFAMTRRPPRKVADIGAGTGQWYQAIRRTVGPAPSYYALDQSRAMVQALSDKTLGDPAAEVGVGDAEHLPWPAESIDWVGLHYMLYHVPDIAQALREAWRTLVPGGVLLAAANGQDAYAELNGYHTRACDAVGLHFSPDDSRDRFTLDSGSPLFPMAPEVRIFSNDLKFPTVDEALAYYGSGYFQHGLSPEDIERPDVRQALLRRVGEEMAETLNREGAIWVHSQTGYFWAAKS